VGVTFLNGVISGRLNVSVPREAVLPWGSSTIVKMRINLQEDVHMLLCVCVCVCVCVRLEASDGKNDGETVIKRGC
jgi:hypothetical protein